MMDDIVVEIEQVAKEAWESTEPPQDTVAHEEMLVAAAHVMARLGLPANIPELAEQFLDAVNAALREQSEGDERVKLDALTQLLQGRQGKLFDGSLQDGEIRDRAQLGIEMALYFLFGNEKPRDEAPDGYYYLLDNEGNPVSTKNRRAVELLLRDGPARTIAKTFMVYRGIGVEVSTVFLVLNHAHFGGPPVLWETMTFSECDHIDGHQWRYTSRKDAEQGHKDAVAFVRAEIKQRIKQSPRRQYVAQRRILAGKDVLRRCPTRHRRYMVLLEGRAPIILIEQQGGTP